MSDNVNGMVVDEKTTSDMKSKKKKTHDDWRWQAMKSIIIKGPSTKGLRGSHHHWKREDKEKLMNKVEFS